jgi:hypothetical protein
MKTEIFDKYGNEISIGDTTCIEAEVDYSMTLNFFEVQFRFGMACVDITYSKTGKTRDDFEPLWDHIEGGAYLYRRKEKLSFT